MNTHKEDQLLGKLLGNKRKEIVFISRDSRRASWDEELFPERVHRNRGRLTWKGSSVNDWVLEARAAGPEEYTYFIAAKDLALISLNQVKEARVVAQTIDGVDLPLFMYTWHSDDLALLPYVTSTTGA